MGSAAGCVPHEGRGGSHDRCCYCRGGDSDCWQQQCGRQVGLGGEVAGEGGGGEGAEGAEGGDAGHGDRYWQLTAGAGGADADGGEADSEQGEAADAASADPSSSPAVSGAGEQGTGGEHADRPDAVDDPVTEEPADGDGG